MADAFLLFLCRLLWIASLTAWASHHSTTHSPFWCKHHSCSTSQRQDNIFAFTFRWQPCLSPVTNAFITSDKHVRHWRQMRLQPESSKCICPVHIHVCDLWPHYLATLRLNKQHICHSFLNVVLPQVHYSALSFLLDDWVALPTLASGHDARAWVDAVYVHAPFSLTCKYTVHTCFSIFTPRQWRTKDSLYPLCIQHASYKAIRRSKICAAQRHNELLPWFARSTLHVGFCSFYLHCVVCQVSMDST